MNLKEPEIQTNEKFENQDLESKLKELKVLFEKGLLPEKIYLERVSQLI
jgi:hypothetical protein